MAPKHRKIESHSIRFGLWWFLSGMLWTLLLVAALNALSYFYRAGDSGGLYGYLGADSEAIGFPYLIWSERRFSSSGQIDSQALLKNLLVALAASLPGGLLWMLFFNHRLTNSIIRLAIRKHNQNRSQKIRLQFSLRSILLLTTVVAVIMAGLNGSDKYRQALLVVIYLAGPWITVFASLRSGKLVDWHRRFVVYGTLFSLLAGALALGLSLPGISDFTRVFLGVFVFWVPQCVFSAIVPLLVVRLGYCRRGLWARVR